MSSETEIRPFRVDMPDEAIAELRQRIAATRWPSRELVTDRSQGVQLATITELAATGRPITTGARARPR
jgi:epoxide hydrolase-like protein